MIAIQRSSRDGAGCVFPVLVLFTFVCTYISLAAHGLAPVWGSISPGAYWLAPLISAFLWIALSYYIYGLAYPVVYRTEVYDDRIVFSQSTDPDGQLVVNRSNVVRFYIEPRKWWHNTDSIYSVVYQTKSNQVEKISWNYVYDNTAQEFFDAVAELWGNRYIPD